MVRSTISRRVIVPFAIGMSWTACERPVSARYVAQVATGLPGEPQVDATLAAASKALKDRDYETAARLARDGASRAEGSGDREHAIEFYNLLGGALAGWKKPREACAAYRSAFDMLAASGRPAQAAAAGLSLGLMYAQLYDADNASQILKAAASLFESANDTLGAARCWDVLGQSKAKVGTARSLAEAEALIIHAQSVYRSAGRSLDVARCEGNLSDVYRLRSEYRLALEHGIWALDATTSMAGDTAKLERAKDLDLVGLVYERLGQASKAEGYLVEEQAILEHIGSPQRLAFCLSNLGVVENDLHHPERALELDRRALEIRRQSRVDRNIAVSLLAVGEAEAELGHPDDAIRSYLEALKLSELGTGQQAQAANCRYQLGNAYMEAGRLDEALASYQIALRLYSPLADNRNVIWTLNRLGLVYERRGELAKAEASHHEALSAFEKLMREVTDPEDFGSFRETSVVLYPGYARVLVMRGQAKRGFEIAERARAAGLERQSMLSNAGFSALIGNANAREWRAAASQIPHTANLLRHAEEVARSAASPSDSGRAVDKAKAAYADAVRRMQEVRDRMFATVAALRSYHTPPQPSTSELLAYARRHPDTVFVEFMVDEHSTLLFAMSAKLGIRAFALPVRSADLRNAVGEWRAALARGGGRGAQPIVGKSAQASELKLARGLYDRILSTAEARGYLDNAQYGRLVVVADGPLLGIPFAALCDARGHRLIDRFSISNTVSIGQLLHPSAHSASAATILCVADPFTPGEQRVVVPSDGTFGSLVHARAEGRAVCRLFRHAALMVGTDARESRVKQLMAQYGILHFASHGVLVHGDAMASGVVLSAEPETGTEDGLLQAWEIADMHLKSRLVVLSACETAEGEESVGEGLMGLTWAFQSAGCPSTVASQWNVDDAATEALMVGFYRELLAGRAVDDALRRAMLTLRQDSRYRQPSYWAAFQVIGDPSPIFPVQRFLRIR